MSIEAEMKKRLLLDLLLLLLFILLLFLGLLLLMLLNASAATTAAFLERTSEIDVEWRRGRPTKKRWKNCVRQDLREKGLNGNEDHKKIDPKCGLT